MRFRFAEEVGEYAKHENRLRTAVTAAIHRFSATRLFVSLIADTPSSFPPIMRVLIDRSLGGLFAYLHTFLSYTLSDGLYLTLPYLHT